MYTCFSRKVPCINTMTSSVCCKFELDQIILWAQTRWAHHNSVCRCRWGQPSMHLRCTSQLRHFLVSCYKAVSPAGAAEMSLCVLHYKKLFYRTESMIFLLGEWETSCHWSLLLSSLFYFEFVWYRSLLRCSHMCTQMQVRFQGCLYPVFIH